MNKVKKDALWWTIVGMVWVFMLVAGYVGKQNSIAMVAMILAPIAIFNAVKKWIMVHKGWEI